MVSTHLSCPRVILGLFVNASTGAVGSGPATLFKDLKSIEAFIKFYQGQLGVPRAGVRGEDAVRLVVEPEPGRLLAAGTR